MQLRSFLAKDMREALAAMRTAMGENAIIVASETLKDGTVLLRAGIEDGGMAPSAENNAPRSDRVPDTNEIPRFAAAGERYRETLLARLREAGSQDRGRAAVFDAGELKAILRAHRTPEPHVTMLVSEAEKSGLCDMTLALATALDKAMRIDPLEPENRRAILLMGPPGVGKTSVAARLAAQQCLAGCSVLLAATDLATAGQAARLENFGACLNVPVVQVSAPDILTATIEEARASNALLIADSGGCDPRETIARELAGFLSAGNIEIVGTLSATGDAEEAGEIAAALMKFGAKRLIVTGLDLSRRKGALVAIALCGAAIAHVTSSPFLADGLETLTPMALARMLMARAPAAVQKAA